MYLSIRQSIRLSIISIYIYIHINIYINININIIQYLSISISLFMICFTISPASWLQNLHALLGFGDDIAEIPILQFLQGTNLHQTCFLSVKSERKKNMTISEFIFGISWWFHRELHGISWEFQGDFIGYFNGDVIGIGFHGDLTTRPFLGDIQGLCLKEWWHCRNHGNLREMVFVPHKLVGGCNPSEK